MAIVSGTKRRILEAIEAKPAHGYEISRRLRLPLTGIYAHLGELSREGFVLGERDGRRTVYRLSEKGRLLLRALR